MNQAADDLVSPAAVAGLDYAPPEEAQPDEVVAVWRVAWWAALAWALGVACWFGTAVWEGLTTDDHTPWLWVSWGYMAVAIGLLACGAALVVARIARAGPVTVKWIAIAGLGLVAGYVFFQAAANVVYGSGSVDARSFIFYALVWVSRAGGLALLAAVALQPARGIAARLALIAAAVLLASVASYAFSIGSIVFSAQSFEEARDNLLIRGWLIEHARYGLILAAAVLLILAAASAHRRRWPFIAAGAMVVVAALGGSLAQYTVGFWGIQRTVAAFGAAFGANLLIASPAVGLLAWRPGRST